MFPQAGTRFRSEEVLKKIIGLILVLCMLLSVFAVGSYSTSAVETKATPASSGSTEPQKKIQGAAILHCFDWSYTSIKNNLKAIKDAGYTAVQTSPVQPPKDYGANWRDQQGQWWKLYQPIGIRIADGNSGSAQSQSSRQCVQKPKNTVSRL